jgi:GDP-4-dehydro-6-deoxy-D-mannose reductase
MTMTISTILVTGANGFLGSHILQLLQKENLEIHTIGTDPPSIGTYHTIAHNEKEKLRALIFEIEPDAIIHLAGVSFAHDFSLYYEINVNFAINLIQAVKEWGNNHCPVLLTGSSAEYGKIDSNDLPITEITPTRPYDHYGISKLTQTLMGVRESSGGWPFIMIRPFNILGPGMPEHLVVQSFVRQLSLIHQKKQPAVLEVGNLASARDFVNVNDATQAIWQLIQCPEAFGEIINICSGKGTAIHQILDYLLEMTKIDVEVREKQERVRHNDIPMHFGSCEKLKRLTGFTPKETLRETLNQILKFESLV